MSHKNRDERNRWRNKTVAFRVSPEEDKQLETYVKLEIPGYSRHCGNSWQLFWRNSGGSKPEQKWTRSC